MNDWFRTDDGDYLNLDRAKLVRPVGLGKMRLFFEWDDGTGVNAEQDYDVEEPDASRLRRHLNATAAVHKYGVFLGFDNIWMERAQTLANQQADSSVTALIGDLLEDAWKKRTSEEAEAKDV